jgi:hypothetical protein
MTAKEARKAANAFNSIKDDIIYKKIQEAIEKRASKGEYWVIVSFSNYELEISNNSSLSLPVKERLKMILESFCNDSYRIKVKIYKIAETLYEIKIDWSNGNATGSIEYI